MSEKKIFASPIESCTHAGMGEARAQSGSEDAAELQHFRAELNDQFRSALMAFFGKRVGSRSEAEDLTQEVFVRLLARPEAPIAASVRPYVFAVAANLLRDRARRAATHHDHAHVPIDDHICEALVEDRGPERVLLGKTALEEAIAALGELSETTRDIFVLFRLEKMRQRDIAARYGLSVSTIEKHIMRAMSHLGARFAARMDER